MGQVTPPRERTFLYDFKSRQAKHSAPVLFCLKRAWSSSTTPLPIVCPANYPVPPYRRYILIDDREAAVTQYTAHLIQHETRILRVMKNIAKQHGVKSLVTNGKMTAIVGQVIDTRGRAGADV